MIHTADRIQQGGLAASAWSHNGNEFPFVNGKIHIAQNVILLFIYDKAFAQLSDLNHCFHIDSSSMYSDVFHFLIWLRKFYSSLKSLISHAGMVRLTIHCAAMADRMNSSGYRTYMLSGALFSATLPIPMDSR